MQAGAFAYVDKKGKNVQHLVEVCKNAAQRWHDTYIPEHAVKATEAIAVLDLIGSTKSADRHGWESVGRPRFRMLREFVVHETPRFGLSCQKSTGDGYLLTFHNDAASARAVPQAIRAIAAISRRVQAYNPT